MEETGMTDMQYKSVLRGIVSDLEEVKEKATGDETAKAIEKLEEMINRFKADIES